MAPSLDATWRGGAAALLIAGCASAPRPLADEPIPATDRDPPSWTPAASAEGHGGEPVALSLSGGSEQARALLRRLVLAVRDRDETAVSTSLAEHVGHAQPTALRSTWTRAALARQILTAAAASNVDEHAAFDALIDPETIQVLEASAHYAGHLPSGVDPSDVVVTFQATALGRRLLAGLAASLLVVRPGPTPLVVAR
ncbi:MAG: hypothetical protein U0234_04605 [Sandaracinus sp.]